SLRRAQTQGDRGTESTATSNLAMVLKDLGETEQARRTAEVAVELNREFNGPYAVARTLGILAGLQEQANEYTAARATNQEALELDIAVDDKQDQVFRLGALGHLAIVFGQYDEAERLLIEGVGLSRAIDEKNAEASNVADLAVLRLKQGDARAALEHSHAALALVSDIGYPNNKGVFLLTQGDIH